MKELVPAFRIMVEWIKWIVMETKIKIWYSLFSTASVLISWPLFAYS